MGSVCISRHRREIFMQNEIITLLKEKNLTEARKRLAQLNEADIAELFDELSNEEIICLFRLLSKSTGPRSLHTWSQTFNKKS